MRYSGTLTQWNDERGFGWIEADGGGERLFVHISAFEPRPPAEQRPQPGLRLEFAVGMEQGRKRALQVAWRAGGSLTQARRRNSPSAGRLQSSRTPPQGWHASSGFSYGVLLVWLLLMLAAAVIWGVPRILWLVYAGLSMLTFMAYWQDKWAAQKGQWRTPEKTLQTMALAGGWPGALLAQQWLRHKSSKTSFQLQFWLMVLINVVAVLWLCSPYGRHVLA
ncbi:DNA-binding protein [Comamonas testosteroni]|uniref:DNA-binding protein n=2 Tax=Comamonas testosteroni TaxID=285 RepID=A0A5A7MA72_COMTE|nr:DNA-binding protein [Comamonas testosteroni]